MTRAEAKEVLIVKAGYGTFVENIIDQIYNDHEAQLKTFKQQCLEEAEPKYEQYFSLLSDFTSLEAQLKAKDELIEELECRAYHAEGYINDLHNKPKEQQWR